MPPWISLGFAVRLADTQPGELFRETQLKEHVFHAKRLDKDTALTANSRLTRIKDEFLTKPR